MTGCRCHDPVVFGCHCHRRRPRPATALDTGPATCHPIDAAIALTLAISTRRNLGTRTVHAIPGPGRALTPCCGKTLGAIPMTDKITADGASVTCATSRP